MKLSGALNAVAKDLPRALPDITFNGKVLQEIIREHSDFQKYRDKHPNVEELTLMQNWFGTLQKTPEISEELQLQERVKGLLETSLGTQAIYLKQLLAMFLHQGGLLDLPHATLQIMLLRLRIAQNSMSSFKTAQAPFIRRHTSIYLKEHEQQPYLEIIQKFMMPRLCLDEELSQDIEKKSVDYLLEENMRLMLEASDLSSRTDVSDESKEGTIRRQCDLILKENRKLVLKEEARIYGEEAKHIQEAEIDGQASSALKKLNPSIEEIERTASCIGEATYRISQDSAKRFIEMYSEMCVEKSDTDGVAMPLSWIKAFEWIVVSETLEEQLKLWAPVSKRLLADLRALLEKLPECFTKSDLVRYLQQFPDPDPRYKNPFSGIRSASSSLARSVKLNELKCKLIQSLWREPNDVDPDYLSYLREYVLGALFGFEKALSIENVQLHRTVNIVLSSLAGQNDKSIIPLLFSYPLFTLPQNHLKEIIEAWSKLDAYKFLTKENIMITLEIYFDIPAKSSARLFPQILLRNFEKTKQVIAFDYLANELLDFLLDEIDRDKLDHITSLLQLLNKELLTTSGHIGDKEFTLVQLACEKNRISVFPELLKHAEFFLEPDFIRAADYFFKGRRFDWLRLLLEKRIKPLIKANTSFPLHSQIIETLAKRIERACHQADLTKITAQEVIKQEWDAFQQFENLIQSLLKISKNFKGKHQSVEKLIQIVCGVCKSYVQASSFNKADIFATQLFEQIKQFRNEIQIKNEKQSKLKNKLNALFSSGPSLIELLDRVIEREERKKKNRARANVYDLQQPGPSGLRPS